MTSGESDNQEASLRAEAMEPPKIPRKSAVAPVEIALPALDTTARIATPSTTTSHPRSEIPPKHPSTGRSVSRRKKESSSKKKSTTPPKKFRECICGRGVACLGMSQAFRMLGDPRCHHVELPRYRKDPPGFKYVFRNNLREAYLRELLRQNPTNENLREELETQETGVPKKRKFVALHHFHPRVIRAFYENPLTSAQRHKVPISITEHELKELGMEIRDEDKILSVSGIPTGGFYFTPGYSHENAHKDLKLLIQAVRNGKIYKKDRHRSIKSTDSKKELSNVPKDIEIATPTNDVVSDVKARPASFFRDEKEPSGNDEGSQTEIGSSTKNKSQKKREVEVLTGILESGDEDATEFNKIWEKSTLLEPDSNFADVLTIEEERESSAIDQIEGTGSDKDENDEQQPIKKSLSSRRSVDRPWATPKYRRNRDNTPKLVSGAADYIDPNNTGELNSKLASATNIVDDGEDIARIAADMTVLAQERLDVVSPLSTPASPKPNRDIIHSARFSPKALYSPSRRFAMEDDTVSLGSQDSVIKSYTKLDHQLPGADPTLRIQVHNDLIAWESKRRSDLSQQLEYNRERWQAASDVLTDGIAEAKYAERLILGISKASRLFADSLRAVYDDKLLDDKGKAVKNSFIRNRLAKQRNAFEYSIENSTEDSGSGLGSVLLDSIVSAQLDIADSFIENSDHMEQTILPELTELRDDIQRSAHRLQLIGEGVIAELKQSEVEVKNIWDVFDAMVTGDLMEYTIHGSSHGGSSHGGSFHSTSMNTGGSGSIHGFLTARDENEAPVVSSAASPLVKTTFQQLGRIEDGWLIEMYYKSAVAYQRSVFGAAEMELRNLFQEVSSLEEMRFRKLHQFMLAFAPRQRRLFSKLPEHFKNVLENMVGLRIDEESLQKVIDESVKDRSKDHLKGSTAHKSSILNRSKINARVDAAENEIEDMEKTYGSPFASPMILLSKMVELKATGFASLVNNAWKPSLAVVTSEGNILVFVTSENANTPPEAFKSLYPQMNFDDPNTWVEGRKIDIVKSLTPIVSIRLTKSSLVISQLRKSQIEITEEAEVVAGSRFMNAVKSGVRQTKSTLSRSQQTKCTIRLPSASAASDWVSLLERTKKVLNSQATSRRASKKRF